MAINNDKSWKLYYYIYIYIYIYIYKIYGRLAYYAAPHILALRGVNYTWFNDCIGETLTAIKNRCIYAVLTLSLSIYIYIYIYRQTDRQTHTQGEGSRGLIVKALDCGIVVSESKQIVLLVGWFYGTSTLIGLFNAEVSFFFSSNYMDLTIS